MKDRASVPSSFRDPSGFVFWREGELFRQVNLAYKDDYDQLIGSGLYRELTTRGLLIPHEEVGGGPAPGEEAYRLIKPELIPFISYPYEWSFSQLKDAALVTLEIQRRSLDCGLSLKDCSGYNIQFKGGRPLLIDTLSFERYREGQPWVAYRQFCQHLLAPLALMSYTDIRLSQLLKTHLDGIPLDLASALLPARTRLVPSLALHIHLHAKSQRRFATVAERPRGRRVSLLALRGLVSSLEGAISRLRWRPRGTEWADYYRSSRYSSEAMEHKKRIVGQFLEILAPRSVWDLGANTGLFSRLAAERGIPTIAFDLDPAAVEINYLECKKSGQRNLLPLLMDLTNPSPAICWGNEERPALLQRGRADTALALALIHHLAISNNLSLSRIAGFLSGLCDSLILEFVPKSDAQVQRLLATRDDIFGDYTQQACEAEFGRHFEIRDAIGISGSERTLYLLLRGCSGAGGSRVLPATWSGSRPGTGLPQRGSGR